jgi:serine/threonine-protein kinase
MVTCGRCQSKAFIPSNLEPFATVPCKKCEHPLMLPVMLHHYELRTVVASGGMGTVFTAFDTKLEREVAVKMVKREAAQDAEIMSAFYREARATARLNHTNIIHIYSFNEFDGQPYLVMELANCGSVDGLIERDQRVSELKVLDIGVAMASALNAALKHGLLHRDIKPGNILFNADGEPKLIDFGLACAASATDAVNGQDPGYVWGTPEYVAPEKIEQKGETFLSDMYSLGCTLYHALTGHIPFTASNVTELVQAHVYTPMTPPHYVVPDITEQTSNVIQIMMAKNPAERYPTYDHLYMALEQARSYVLIQKVQRDSMSE